MELSRRIETALDSMRNWSKSSAARPALQRCAARCKAVYRNRRCRPSAVARAPECGLVVETSSPTSRRTLVRARLPPDQRPGSVPVGFVPCATPSPCGAAPLRYSDRPLRYRDHRFRNGRSCSTGLAGHDAPECAHVGPESAITLLRKPHDRPRKCQRQVCSKAVSAWGDGLTKVVQ